VWGRGYVLRDPVVMPTPTSTGADDAAARRGTAAA